MSIVSHMLIPTTDYQTKGELEIVFEKKGCLTCPRVTVQFDSVSPPFRVIELVESLKGKTYAAL